MEFGVDFGGLATRRWQSRMLGDRVVPLNHPVGVQEMSNLAKAGDVHYRISGYGINELPGLS